VSDPRDDDALSWGDDDPTLDVGAASAGESGSRRSARPRLPDGYRAVGKGSDEVADTDGGDAATDGHPRPAPDAPKAERAQLGNSALIALGVLGGVYLLYTLGWFIGGLRLQDVAPLLLVSPVAYVPAFWLAVLAPAIWFTVTLILTRHSATWLRFVWLGAGALLLVPWPFIMIGAVGQ
jgi:hypothetical protein